MSDETEHSPKKILSGEAAHHPQHVRRAEHEAGTPIEVESAAFFAEGGAASPPPPAEPQTPDEPPKPDEPELVPFKPHREHAGAVPAEEAPAALPTKRGMIMLILQAVLSAAALVQLARTRMLPAHYLAILGVLLALFWVVVWRCQRYRTSGAVARVFSLALCAVMALGCVWAQQGLSALDNVTAGNAAGAEAEKITIEPFIVYLSGVDTRGELTENARSDVNILAVVNPESKRVALINTPRDYYVDLAGTSSKDKLTHAGLYGVQTSMATLGSLYGVNVAHYIRINFAGFISIVDAVGGVDVYSDYAFTSVGSPGYYDPTTFVEGWNHLDGKAALAFARERHAFASGDIQRGINQMKVIDAMVNKIKSPALLVSFSKLLDAVSDCFVTSLSSEQISALVRMQLSDMADWDIQSYTVTGSGSYSTKCYSAQGQKLYVMLPDANAVSEAKALIDSVLGGEQAAEGPAAPQLADGQTAHVATGDPNAGGTPSLDETPAESEIELPASSEEQPAESAAPEADASTELPAESAAGESEASSWPSQSEVEQAASSLAGELRGLWNAIKDSASEADTAAPAPETAPSEAQQPAA